MPIQSPLRFVPAYSDFREPYRRMGAGRYGAMYEPFGLHEYMPKVVDALKKENGFFAGVRKAEVKRITAQSTARYRTLVVFGVINGP